MRSIVFCTLFLVFLPFFCDGRPPASGVNLKLYREASEGRIRKLSTLLNHGADPNYQNSRHNGKTAIHAAVLAGNAEILDVLIDFGGNLNIPDFAGRLPLHDACESGSIEILTMLLDFGAATGDTDSSGITPLDVCISNGHSSLISELRSRGGVPGSAVEHAREKRKTAAAPAPPRKMSTSKRAQRTKPQFNEPVWDWKPPSDSEEATTWKKEVRLAKDAIGKFMKGGEPLKEFIHEQTVKLQRLRSKLFG